MARSTNTITHSESDWESSHESEDLSSDHASLIEPSTETILSGVSKASASSSNKLNHTLSTCKTLRSNASHPDSIDSNIQTISSTHLSPSCPEPLDHQKTALHTRIHQILLDAVHASVTRDFHHKIPSSFLAAKQNPDLIDGVDIKIIDITLDKGRLYCPIHGCNRHFKQFEGMKYHISTFEHDIPSFIKCYAAGATAGKRFISLEANIADSSTSKAMHESVALVDSDLAHRTAHMTEIDQILNSSDWNVDPNSPPIILGHYSWLNLASRVTPPLPIIFSSKISAPKRTEAPLNRLASIDELYINSLNGNHHKLHKMDILPSKKLIGILSIAEAIVDQDLVSVSNFKPPFDLVLPKDVKSYFAKQNDLEVTIKSGPSNTKHSIPHMTSVYSDSGSRKRMILNVGCSVWGLEWCPGIPRSHKCQYLAVAGYREFNDNHVLNERHTVEQHGETSMSGAIQIWSVPAFPSEKNIPKLELIILHKRGHVLHLNWCTPALFVSPKQNSTGQMGVLAACFGDGSAAAFSVPLPDSFRACLSKQEQTAYETHPISYAIHKNKLGHSGLILDMSCPDMLFWRVAWGSQHILAVGSQEGRVLIVNTKTAIKSADFDIDRDVIVGFQAHDSAVRHMSWCILDKQPVRHLISAGLDGRISYRDILDPWARVDISRFRIPFAAVTWMSAYDSIILSDTEYYVRIMSLTPDTKEELDLPKRHAKQLASHNATIWRVDGSLFFPFVASASANGVFMLAFTLKLGRKPRKPIGIYRLQCEAENTHSVVFDEICLESSLSESVEIHPIYNGVQQVHWCPNLYNEVHHIDTEDDSLTLIDEKTSIQAAKTPKVGTGRTGKKPHENKKSQSSGKKPSIVKSSVRSSKKILVAIPLMEKQALSDQSAGTSNTKSKRTSTSSTTFSRAHSKTMDLVSDKIADSADDLNIDTALNQDMQLKGIRDTTIATNTNPNRPKKPLHYLENGEYCSAQLIASAGARGWVRIDAVFSGLSVK
ncbi:hypothetical protein O5D80_001088 [Batrachochytrium dendrobatidis]|nr:hypothetical protein O5D80_001088 [Batrachochytrium dendrobatidis]